MSELNELTVTMVGITTVFVVFVILYVLFKLFELFGSSGGVAKPVRTPKPMAGEGNVEVASKGQVLVQTPVDDSEEIAAVFAAVYALLGTGFKVKTIKRVERTVRRVGTREWIEWRNHGWRGGNRW